MSLEHPLKGLTGSGTSNETPRVGFEEKSSKKKLRCLWRVLGDPEFRQASSCSKWTDFNEPQAPKEADLLIKHLGIFTHSADLLAKAIGQSPAPRRRLPHARLSSWTSTETWFSFFTSSKKMPSVQSKNYLCTPKRPSHRSQKNKHRCLGCFLFQKEIHCTPEQKRNRRPSCPSGCPPSTEHQRTPGASPAPSDPPGSSYPRAWQLV